MFGRNEDNKREDESEKNEFQVIKFHLIVLKYNYAFNELKKLNC